RHRLRAWRRGLAGRGLLRRHAGLSGAGEQCRDAHTEDQATQLATSHAHSHPSPCSRTHPRALLVLYTRVGYGTQTLPAGVPSGPTPAARDSRSGAAAVTEGRRAPFSTDAWL